MRGRLFAVTAVLMLLSAPSAWALGQGTSMLAVGLSHGNADFAGPEAFSAGFLPAFDHPEAGVQGQFWHLFSDDYAFAISAGVGLFNEKNEPGTNAPAGDGEFKYSQTSFNVRVGGDRVVQVGDRAVLYFGPGVEFWNGKAKFEQMGVSAFDIETEATTRISLHGRMGGIMLLGDSFGLSGQVGHKVGYASVEEAGAKTTWWPSSLDAAGGLTFIFGGK